MTTEYHAKCGCGAEISLHISKDEWWSCKGTAFDDWLKTHAKCVKPKPRMYKLNVKRKNRY